MRFVAAFALFAITLVGSADAARPVQFASAPPAEGALVLPLGSAADLDARAVMLDRETRAAVARALASADFEYEANSTLRLRGLGPWSQILVIGTGDKPLNAFALQEVGGTAAQQTAGEDGPVALVATGFGGEAAVDIALGARLGGYQFDRYRSADPDHPRPAGREAPLTLITADPDSAENAWSRTRALADAVALTRDLSNEPGNIIYPESFVERTREAFSSVSGVEIQVLDVPEMERLGMGSILSVGRGSARPPRMMIVQYRGAGAPEAPVVIAGKGITFDSGGISLKGDTGMWKMKGDMTGAAAAVSTVLSLARAQAPVHVVGIAALAENMPGGRASRPGDVVRAINGKTIEIVNTDAEGRLVLADAVAYAERRFQPAAIVDVATLTGSVGRAVGEEYAGLFTENEALAAQLTAAGEVTGEKLWRLPLHTTYARDVRSKIADVRNSTEGASPGASHGAHFIQFFVDETPWAHLDIASVDHRPAAKPTVPEGMSGFGVRLLDRFVRDFRPVPAQDGGSSN